MYLEKVAIGALIRKYRYASLVWTTICYLVSVQHDMFHRILVIGGMTVAAFTIDYLYQNKERSTEELKWLLLLEVVCNSMLLMASGGIESPYIWYSVNTLLVTSIEIGVGAMWLNTGVYIAVMLFATQLQPFFETPHNRLTHMNLVTALIVVAAAISVVVKYATQVKEEREKLEQYLNYSVKVYESIHMLTTTRNQEKLVEVLLSYIEETMKASGACIALYDDEKVHMRSKGIKADTVSYLEQLVISNAKVRTLEEPQVTYYKEDILGINIQYNHNFYGMIFIKGMGNHEALSFLGYITTLVCEKNYTEELNQLLIRNQEQNRIANEIHDSILQKLFGISCKLFVLSQNALDDTVKDGLLEARTGITEAMGELRRTIYGMSWNKEGSNTFIDKLEEYITFMEGCHPITISLQIDGDLCRLSIEQEKVIYRVCCEAIANAIRHGKAKQVCLWLGVESESVQFQIEDDGIGFEYRESVQREAQGLGLRNMTQLVASSNGAFELHSDIGKGTSIKVALPMSVKRSEGIA